MIRSLFRTTVLCLTMVMMASAVGVRAEDEAPRAPKAPKVKIPSVKGTVSAVGSDTITLTVKGKKDASATEVTVSVDQNTRIRVNGAKATLADIKIGFTVQAVAEEGKPALKITAKDPSAPKAPKGKKKPKKGEGEPSDQY